MLLRRITLQLQPKVLLHKRVKNSLISKVITNNKSTQNDNKAATSIKDNDEENSATINKKQDVKPDLSTFPGLSLFFTDVKNNVEKMPKQTANTTNNNKDQSDKDAKTSVTIPQLNQATVSCILLIF